MTLGTGSIRARCAAVWLGGTAAAALVMTVLWPVVWPVVWPVLCSVLAEVLTRPDGVGGAPPSGGSGFEEVLVRGCACIAAILTAWLWLVTTRVVLGAASGLPTSRRGVPASLHRALLALCGVALTGGMAGPAVATGDAPGVLNGLRLPERVAVARHAPPARHLTQPPAAATVVVATGDTLWGLAAAALGPGASDAETAHAWPRIYARNREVVGPDPGVLEPGQHLVIPRALGGGR